MAKYFIYMHIVHGYDCFYDEHLHIMYTHTQTHMHAHWNGHSQWEPQCIKVLAAAMGSFDQFNYEVNYEFE